MSSQSTIDRVTGNENVKRVLFGFLEAHEDYVQSYEDYDDIYRVRHDCIHSILCDQLNIEFGERTVEDVFKTNQIQIINDRYYDQVKNQTPDYLIIKGKNVEMIEITVSTDLKARHRKESKYALLLYFLTSNKFKIDYKILVVNPRNVYSDRQYMYDVFGLDETHIDTIKLVCDNAAKLFQVIHRTTRGSGFYRRRFEIDQSEIKLNVTNDDVLNTFQQSIDKPFHSEIDLINLLRSERESVLTHDDGDFLDELLKLDVSSELISEEKFNKTEFLMDLDRGQNTNRLRSVFPIPFFQLTGLDSAVRSTESDYNDLSRISSLMRMASNCVINRIGDVLSRHLSANFGSISENDDFLFSISFSEEEKSEIAMDGPGRKRFIRKGSAQHKKSESDRDNYWLSSSVDVGDIDRLSYYFSKKERVESKGVMIEDVLQLVEARGIGFDYVRICQSIYREININSMRGDRRHKMIIKPTGINGLFVCLYPGPKLRCGELANNVWFKIIVENSFLGEDGIFQNHWTFKNLLRDTHISHSRWLSCDVHRLDHYIRCYDKILMAYSSVMAVRFKSVVDLSEYKEKGVGMNALEDSEIHHPLYKLINEDTTNVLGLIIMTYMEDRRVTSKMLQNVRYIVMSSISIFPKLKSSMSKLIEPVRSPLQLFYIKKLCDYCSEMKTWNPGKNCHFGNIRFDSTTQTFSDRLGGSKIRLPRPLVGQPGDYAEFSEILCEMYFTMLFNKNQDDPTHASFQILGKILEGEESYQESKKQGTHLGYMEGISDLEFAKIVLRDKKTHTFSSRAIEIGSKLLRDELGDHFGEQINASVKRMNVNKTLDHFATFKSSTDKSNEYYDPQEKRQTSRTKCIGNCNKLVKDGLRTSFEVAEQYKNEETTYQVFKKNQIGGVREILILPLTVRIRINILETISRNICNFDSREMLTHGTKKYEMVKSLLYSAKKLPGKRAPIHLTMDKSRWGPSFVPIQFIYLFSSFRQQLGGVFPLIVDLLIKHQNKRCYLPERLMKAWHLDEDQKYTHGDKRLQRLKEIFLRKKQTSMRNESNMGQGILHFTSSYLHLAMIAFRNDLYRRACNKNGWPYEDHFDLLSSDDSYTLLSLELEKKDKLSYIRGKITLFLKCQQISEYLFNCRTSLVKSSVNPLIGEFNSLFVSNMSFMPALLKFAIASVHPMNTDSFYRMVKESYSSSRQIVENGGTLDLYLLSSLLNKKYCEEIYHTNKGGHNDLFKLGISHMSYQLGHFPIFNPSLMLMFGPEYYNYKLYRTKWSTMSDVERKLFIASHKMIKGGLVETLAEFEDGDTVMGGMLRIEAKMGPVRQLEMFKRDAILTKEEMEKMLVENPILIIKQPRTLDEVKFKITKKLYTTGSSEALKNLAASIFYGRVSATVSAKVFYIPGVDGDEKKTFFQCVSDLLKEDTSFDFEKEIRFLYPKGPDYDVFTNDDDKNFEYSARNPFEIQTVQTLATHKIYTKLTQSVEDLLYYKWLGRKVPMELESKVGRDFEILKLHYPMIKDTLDQTLDSFGGKDRKQQIKGVLLLILKLFSLRDRSFKGVIYGPGSQDVVQSHNILEELNSTSSLRVRRSLIEIKMRRDYDSYERIYLAHNHLICSYLTKSKLLDSPWDYITREELDSFLLDHSVNKKIKKRIFMCALDRGFIDNVEEWSGRVNIVMHSWSKRQQYKDGNYYGDYEIVIFMGKKRLIIEHNSRRQNYRIYKTDFDDPELLFSMFKEYTEIMQIGFDELINKTMRGNWQIIDDKVLFVKNKEGFSINRISILDPLMFGVCYLEVDIDRTIVSSGGYKIMSIDTGLLSSFALPREEHDFKLFNVWFSAACKIGVFNQDFNVLYKEREDCLECLDDLVVDKPSVTPQTIDRLKLHNWDEVRSEEKFNEIVIEDMTDYFDSMMNVVVDKFDYVGDPLVDMMTYLETTDLTTSTLTVQRIQNTRKILWNLVTLKHNLICHQMLFDMRISRGSIQYAGSIYKGENRKYILFSLISLYDRTYFHGGQRSPRFTTLSVNKEFLEKFRLEGLSDDEELLI